MVKAKEIEGLDCGARASQGIRLVLLTRLEEVREQREAALDTRSEDGIHDMRVASRRLRSAVRDFRPHMRGGRRLEEARADLKRLADALGAVRDEDVAIGALEKLSEEEAGETGEGLKLFADERRARRARAHDALLLELDADTFDAAHERVAAAFERATEPRKKDGEGEESFGELGRAVILRLWEELRGRGADIYRPLKSKRLHKIRIAAKRLRYALELFSACFGEGVKELAKELAEMQKALGNLHDCDEWIEECGDYLSRRDSGAQDYAGVPALERRAAAFRLLEHFLARRDSDYAEALAIWHRWEHDDFGARLVGSLDAVVVEQSGGHA